MAPTKQEEDSVVLTPMIDVFVLPLIFFMVTMKIAQEETKLFFPPLPITDVTFPPPSYPLTNIEIEIQSNAQFVADGLPVDHSGERGFPRLSKYFFRQGQAVLNDPKAEVVVNINPQEQARSQYTADVLYALSRPNKALDTMQGEMDIPKEKRKL